MRFALIVCGVVTIALTGHFAAPWGDGLPSLGTLVRLPGSCCSLHGDRVCRNWYWSPTAAIGVL